MLTKKLYLVNQPFVLFFFLFRYEFPHVEIYEVSYMWYAAIPCIWTIVVGTLVSFLTKPQDPKTLNPDLISPGFYQAFGGCWPKFINNYLIGLGIGSKWVKDEKYHTLVEQQIKTSGHVDHQETGQSNGMKNPGFEMSEKNIEVF